MKVVVHSAEWCPWCERVKEFLREHGIEFEEKNVEIKENGEELVRISGQEGIPVTVVNDKEVIIGFDEEKLKKALNIK